MSYKVAETYGQCIITEEARQELNKCAGPQDILKFAEKYEIEISEDELETVAGGSFCFVIGLADDIKAEACYGTGNVEGMRDDEEHSGVGVDACAYVGAGASINC